MAGALILAGIALLAAAWTVLAWRQPNDVTLPAPTGPYAVGRTAFDWRDDDRVDAFAPEPGTKRELPVWIWYPAETGAAARPSAYMPDAVRSAMQPNPRGLLRGFVFLMGLISTDRSRVTSHARDAARPLDGESPWPVILLKPARGAAVLQYATFAEDLASHGYVVVGSDSPYTTPGVAYQDGRVALRTAAGAPPEVEPGPVNELAPGQPNDFGLPVIQAWVEDERFILERLEALNAGEPSGQLAGHLDLNAVGVFGHSYGGATALEFCRVDSRCRAGVNVDGAPLGEVVRRGLSAPFLQFLADRPMFEGPEQELRPDQRAVRDAFRRIGETLPNQPNLLRLHGAEHFNFLDQALMTNADLSRLFGGIGAIDPARALEVTRRYLRAFFDSHLKGTPDPLLDRPSLEYPEVRFPSE